MSFVADSSTAPWRSQFPTLRQVCLFLWVSSLFPFCSSWFFVSWREDAVKLPFQMHHKTQRGWLMVALSRWGTLGCPGSSPAERLPRIRLLLARTKAEGPAQVDLLLALASPISTVNVFFC